ncbi:hypothetical protein PoB_000545500 [Plakobranchus ocellatus]|uniref:Uncharacterized protein n=1 Tax=Plakobranchus ocellatus TaxID=259542 RepID=A0AAV3Y745_9GAST|nr:hypothetical protein PoB_000545500 [Plakobranchus ocellatus]
MANYLTMLNTKNNHDPTPGSPMLGLSVGPTLFNGTPNTSLFSPQQGDLRLSGPPSGQGAGGGARTRDRKVPADLRADSLATVPPTHPAPGKPNFM